MSPLAPSPPEAQPLRPANVQTQVIKRHAVGAEGQTIVVVERHDASRWYEAALAEISHLTALAVGWNGYDAREVQADHAINAAQFLANVAPFPGIAPPAIAPLSDGGVQLEWHRGGLDIEIAFSDEEPGVFIDDRQGEEYALPLADAVTVISAYWPRLQET
jgi:hypothetical protein